MKNKTKRSLLVLLLLAGSWAQAQVVTDPATGQSYEYVPFNGAFLTWQESRAAALAREFEGRAGYLVNITSAAENTFIVDQFALDVPEFEGLVWIGGYEPGDEGVWLWADGPEAGVQFSNESMPVPPFNYAGWDPNPQQPGNTGGIEDVALIPLGEDGTIFTRGGWHDAPSDFSAVIGYIVEYPSALPESQPVPVNSIWLIVFLIAGMLGIAVLRK